MSEQINVTLDETSSIDETLPIELLKKQLSEDLASTSEQPKKPVKKVVKKKVVSQQQNEDQISEKQPVISQSNEVSSEKKSTENSKVDNQYVKNVVKKPYKHNEFHHLYNVPYTHPVQHFPYNQHHTDSSTELLINMMKTMQLSIELLQRDVSSLTKQLNQQRFNKAYEHDNNNANHRYSTQSNIKFNPK